MAVDGIRPHDARLLHAVAGLPGLPGGWRHAGCAALHFRRFGGVPINWAIGALGAILMLFAAIVQVFGIHILARLNDFTALCSDLSSLALRCGLTVRTRNG